MLSLEYLPGRVIWVFIAIVFALILGGGALIFFGIHRQSVVKDFETCVKAGNPILSSYPEQCKAGDKLYTNTNPGSLITQ